MKEPQSVHDEIVLLLTRIGALEKDNALLRKALQDILDIYGDDLPGKIARAALAEQEKK